MHEKEHTTITVTELERMFYGSAESKISHDKYKESPEFDAEIDAKYWEIINNGEVLVVVNDTDDGCIDGRWTVKVMFNKDGRLQVELADNGNHERAKVAGGGYMTALAMRIGAGLRGEAVDDDLTDTGEVLAEKSIFCGAHTANHVHGDGTGCGANDEFPLILHNAIAYREGVEKTTKQLIEIAGLTFDDAIFNEIIENWNETVSDETYFADSTGASRLQRILNLQMEKTELSETRKPVAVTKELNGSHKEIAIVVNYVESKTLSQGALAKKLTEEFAEKRENFNPEELPQAFAVDAWRIVELGKAAVPDEAAIKAIYAGVMYQVATAATLTDGSLKITTYTN